MRNGVLKGITKDGLCCLFGKNERWKQWRRGIDIRRNCGWRNCVLCRDREHSNRSTNIQLTFSLFKSLFVFLRNTETQPLNLSITVLCVFMWLRLADKVCSKSCPFPPFLFFFCGFWHNLIDSTGVLEVWNAIWTLLQEFNQLCWPRFM